MSLPKATDRQALAIQEIWGLLQQERSERARQKFEELQEEEVISSGLIWNLHLLAASLAPLDDNATATAEVKNAVQLAEVLGRHCQEQALSSAVEVALRRHLHDEACQWLFDLSAHPHTLDEKQVARSLVHLSRLYLQAGKYDRASALLDRTSSTMSESIWRIEWLVASGDLAFADGHLDDVLVAQVSETLRDDQLVAATLTERFLSDQARLSGDLDTAAAHATTSRRIATGLGAPYLADLATHQHYCRLSELHNALPTDGFPESFPRSPRFRLADLRLLHTNAGLTDNARTAVTIAELYLNALKARPKVGALHLVIARTENELYPLGDHPKGPAGEPDPLPPDHLNRPQGEVVPQWGANELLPSLLGELATHLGSILVAAERGSRDMAQLAISLVEAVTVQLESVLFGDGFQTPVEPADLRAAAIDSLDQIALMARHGGVQLIQGPSLSSPPPEEAEVVVMAPEVIPLPTLLFTLVAGLLADTSLTEGDALRFSIESDEQFAGLAFGPINSWIDERSLSPTTMSLTCCARIATAAGGQLDYINGNSKDKDSGKGGGGHRACLWLPLAQAQDQPSQSGSELEP